MCFFEQKTLQFPRIPVRTRFKAMPFRCYLLVYPSTSSTLSLLIIVPPPKRQTPILHSNLPLPQRFNNNVHRFPNLPLQSPLRTSQIHSLHPPPKIKTTNVESFNIYYLPFKCINIHSNNSFNNINITSSHTSRCEFKLHAYIRKFKPRIRHPKLFLLR